MQSKYQPLYHITNKRYNRRDLQALCIALRLHVLRAPQILASEKHLRDQVTGLSHPPLRGV